MASESLVCIWASSPSLHGLTHSSVHSVTWQRTGLRGFWANELGLVLGTFKGGWSARQRADKQANFPRHCCGRLCGLWQDSLDWGSLRQLRGAVACWPSPAGGHLVTG